MSMGRILKHLIAPQWVINRAFPRAVLDRIEAAITASEASHRGEIRFVVEGGLDLAPLLKGMTPRERALELFSQLRVWDTEENTGVLVYVQFIDHDIEIVADRGISARVPQAEWDAICQRMEEAFQVRRFEQGTLVAIERITALLKLYFPARGVNPDELPDRPVTL
ncbi:MAG: TPM domain-containing protein [Betaproteobacteria bacterium]|nr:TPM domain-containing protein [Betaproteobacteria bacterium]